jgi:hypothetical protein
MHACLEQTDKQTASLRCTERYNITRNATEDKLVVSTGVVSGQCLRSALSIFWNIMPCSLVVYRYFKGGMWWLSDYGNMLHFTTDCTQYRCLSDKTSEGERQWYVNISYTLSCEGSTSTPAAPLLFFMLPSPSRHRLTPASTREGRVCSLASMIPMLKLRGLSPSANYAGRATAACRWSKCQLLRIKVATWSAWRIRTAVISVF